MKIGIRNRELKKLICTTHGHELSGAGMLEGWEVQGGGQKRGEKNGTIVIVYSIQYT